MFNRIAQTICRVVANSVFISGVGQLHLVCHSSAATRC